MDVLHNHLQSSPLELAPPYKMEGVLEAAEKSSWVL